MLQIPIQINLQILGETFRIIIICTKVWKNSLLGATDDLTPNHYEFGDAVVTRIQSPLVQGLSSLNWSVLPVSSWVLSPASSHFPKSYIRSIDVSVVSVSIC